MKKILLYLVVFLFSVSLALAVSVVTNKQEYTGSEQVIITTNQCIGISVVKIINSNNILVDIKGGADNGVFYYNTLSDSADGKYKVTAACTNGAAEAFFCVDASGCLTVTTTAVPAAVPQAVSNVSVAPVAAGGGVGGGAGCVAKWDCYSWSYCDVYLKQTRTCVDLNKCQAAKLETQSCAECAESWVCSAWSECSDEQNYRNCDDEHGCGTTVLKPKLQKLCTEEEPSGPAPAQISSVMPPLYYAPPAEPAAKSFWKDNLFYLITIPLVLIAIVVVIILTFHFLKPKRLAYNLNELKQWVRKERAMGTSDEDIRKILKEHTGWRDEEIAQALESPQQPAEKSGI